MGFVTVTDVRTSPDLRHARVYVSVLGDGGGPSQPHEREATLEGLRSAHGFLQARVAGELRLKRTPTLEFAYDDTTDRALRVEELIDEMEQLVSDADATSRRRASWCSRGSARTSASCSPPTRTPTATRSARWSRCRAC